ncbi:hypothetical protein [Herbidospora sp. RD11066]
MLTAVEYERTAALLRGSRIRSVVYYPLTCGDDGFEVEEWDFGPWHQPTMGVELHTDDACFSAVWGDSFDHHDLEVFPEPMAAHLVMIGEQGGPAAVDVTAHPRWSPLIGRRLTGADILWSEDHVPLAIRLRSREAVVWIAAGCPADYGLGTDDVMVVFTAEFAADVGITRLRVPGSGS